MHVLEVDREEVEHRAECRPEQEGDPDGGAEVPVPEQARRNERVAAAPLGDGEHGQQRQAGRRARQDSGRSPTEVRALDQREHEQRDPEGGAERTGKIEAASRLALAIGRYEGERQHQRSAGQRHVDEEHRLPAEGLGEHAAEQDADHESGRARSAPDRDRSVALAALGECGVDERERGGKDERPAEPLGRAGEQQEFGSRCEPTRERRAGVERETRREDPAPPEHVSGATTEQQEPGGRHRVGADHRLQRLLREAQVTADLRQCYHHDVLIERDDQHCERQQRQRRVAAAGTRPVAPT